jgi:serine/threonine-protein kinase HipA
MNNRCLYCYKELADGQKDFHPRCSRKFFGTDIPPELGYTLAQMAELAASIIQRSVTVPGVQPKLSLTLVSKALDEGGKGRLTIADALGGNYILKPPYTEYPQMPENEHLTMRIAEVFGLNVVPSSLIRMSSGELAYITKRIDRTAAGTKIHMLDMFQILEAFDKYKGSMERIGKALTLYSDNMLLDVIDFFELTVFCFLTGNNDMHLKNFSMIDSEENGWHLAPAYDLLNVAIIIPEDKEELALTLGARKSKLDRSRFKAFGQGLGLTDRQIESAFNRLGSNRRNAFDLIDASFLSQANKDKYRILMSERYKTLQC